MCSWSKAGGNELKGTLQNCVTRDVTSSLIPPLPYPPLFSCPNTEPPCRLFLTNHIISCDTLALPFPHPFYPPVTSYLFICLR